MYEPIHPHRTEYVSKMVPLVCPDRVLSVLHKVSPQFGYILLIVALPYSFIWCVRLVLFLLCTSHYCYLVHNVCTSAIFINIVTVMATPLYDSRGFDLRKGMEIDPSFGERCVVGLLHDVTGV